MSRIEILPNGAARRRISTKHRVSKAAWFWLVGQDSLEIAKSVGWREADVYRHMTTIRHFAKKLRRERA